MVYLNVKQTESQLSLCGKHEGTRLPFSIIPNDFACHAFLGWKEMATLKIDIKSQPEKLKIHEKWNLKQEGHRLKVIPCFKQPSNTDSQFNTVNEISFELPASVSPKPVQKIALEVNSLEEETITKAFHG